jgi:hypothetical protein
MIIEKSEVVTVETENIFNMTPESLNSGTATIARQRLGKQVPAATDT